MPMSFTETVQQSGQLLDYIKNHPIDWNLAIAWIVIVAVGCWLWAEFIELLEISTNETEVRKTSDLTPENALRYGADGK